jgi:hypothetical protein
MRKNLRDLNGRLLWSASRLHPQLIKGNFALPPVTTRDIYADVEWDTHPLRALHFGLSTSLKLTMLKTTLVALVLAASAYAHTFVHSVVRNKYVKPS